MKQLKQILIGSALGILVGLLVTSLSYGRPTLLGSPKATKLANQTCRIDAAGDGKEFLWIDGTDLSAFAQVGFKRAHVSVYDPINAKWLQGWAGEVGSGETLDVETVVNGDFSSAIGWTLNAGWVIGGNVLTATNTTGTANREQAIAAGKLMKWTINCTITSGNFIFRSYGGASLGFITSPEFSTSGVDTWYMTARPESLAPYISRSSSNLTAVCDDMSVKRVLTAPATALNIYTTRTGAVRGWARADRDLHLMR